MSHDQYALFDAEPAVASVPAPVGSLFLAALPAAGACGLLNRQAAGIQRDHQLGGRPRPPALLHVTLADLTGLAHPEPVIRRAVHVVLDRLRHPAFEVAFDQVKSVPTPRSAACVLHGGHGSAMLKALQDWLRKGLAEAGLECRALPPPHLTLLYSPQLAPAHRVEPVAWTVNELVLVRSHVGQSHHEVLDRWPLQGRERVAP